MKNIHVIATDKPSRIKQEYTNKASYVLSRLPLTWRYAQHIYITNLDEIKEGDFVYSTNEDYNIQKVPSKKSVKAYRDCGHYKKIILTTDQDLIADGVQSVDDEFLNWFVNNPTCEEVEVENSSVVKEHIFDGSNDGEVIWEYKIIIPKEEPKQELLPDFKISKNIFDFVTDLSDTNKEEFIGYGYDPNAPGDPDKIDDLIEQKTLEEAAKKYANTHQDVSGTLGKYLVKAVFQDGANYQAKRMYSEEEAGELVYNIIGQYAKHYGIMIDGAKLNELFEQFKKK